MRILVTNDDGIYIPGLAALARAAQPFGDIRIVAPDVEMSSAGHAITSARPLSYKRTPIAGFEAYRVNGTPADCVAWEPTIGPVSTWYCPASISAVISATQSGIRALWRAHGRPFSSAAAESR